MVESAIHYTIDILYIRSSQAHAVQWLLKTDSALMEKNNKPPFWETKTLADMTPSQWESLCDGCGHCCLIKFEDEDTDEILVTNVACRMLDIDTCRCHDYEHRVEHVPTCLVLGPEKKELFRYLPETCAYRCLEEGRALPEWHHLLTDDKSAVHFSGISVKAYAVSEDYIHPDQLAEHIITD